MKNYDIVKEATTLVENQLDLLQALYEAKRTLEEGRSRLLCRCGACTSHRAITLVWLGTLIGAAQPEAAEATEPPAAGVTKSDASLTSDLG